MYIDIGQFCPYCRSENIEFFGLGDDYYQCYDCNGTWHDDDEEWISEEYPELINNNEHIEIIETMKIKSFSHKRTKNLGNYESENLEIHVELDDDDNFDDCFEEARHKVLKALNIPHLSPEQKKELGNKTENDSEWGGF